MALPHVLESIVDWLKAGYPDGVPDRDYVPLLALLARRLTKEEVAAVASHLERELHPETTGANGHVDTADIGVLITQITNELPRQEDVNRVRAQLATAGPFL